MHAMTRLRSEFFADWRNGAATLATLAALFWFGSKLLGWAVFGAVTAPDPLACRAAQGTGACWGLVADKYRLIFFGRYPYEQQWRPLLAMAVVIAMLIASGMPRFWNARGRKLLAGGWAMTLTLAYLLMRGGVAGLASVETILWGGLPLTLMLSLLGLSAAFPLAILIALGRRSSLPL
ncbi:MAG TPA: amino acid ABC transporter permease, partial [Burkholderiaceae bacterium]